MKKVISKLKETKWYVYLISLFLFLFQYGLYRLGNFLSSAIGTRDNVFFPKIQAIDDRIPLLPFFVFIYVLSYLFWIIAPIIVSFTGKENLKKYISTYLISCLIGFIMFTFFPSYMDREAEGLLEISNKSGLSNRLLSLIYKSDGGEMAYNLFPSYHCLLSVTAFLGVYKRNEINKGIKITFLISAILIILSTLFTKQHYIMDSVTGSMIPITIYIILSIIQKGSKKKNE